MVVAVGAHPEEDEGRGHHAGGHHQHGLAGQEPRISVSLYHDHDGGGLELPDQRQQQQRAEHGEGGRHGAGQLRAQPRGGVGDEDQDRVVVQGELACTGVVSG